MSNQNISRTSTTKKDIFTLLKETQKSQDSGLESILYFCGSSQGGKSTIVQKFLDKRGSDEHSIALEYTFGKRTKGQDKDIAHIYELAGGKDLSSLLNIVIQEQTLHQSSFVIVIDATKPEKALEMIEHFIQVIGKRIKDLMDGLESRGSKRPAAMKNHAWKRFGQDHPDQSLINPFPSPLLIIASKYDEFKNLESERKKLFCKTIRYVAHLNGASVLFHSAKDESPYLKQFLSHLAFKTTAPKTLNLDHNKPLMIVAGQDALSQIGQPPSLYTESIKQSIATLEDFKRDFDRYFPNNETDNNGTCDSLDNDPNTIVDLLSFPEPVIDTLLDLKSIEIEKQKTVKQTSKSYSRAKASQIAAN